MDNPRFTVCIPTINRAGILGRAIESALNQSDDLEVVVVDNASTDDTAAVVASFPSRVRYVKQPTRVSMAENHRTARHASTGQYVTLLYDDEVLLPGTLEQRGRILDEHPEVVAVGCSSATFEGDRIVPGKAIRRRATIEGRTTFLARTFSAFIGSTPCWLVRREVSNQIELRPNELSAADNGIVLRLSCHGKIGLVPEAGVTISPGEGEQSRDGTMEVVQAASGGRPQLPTLLFATGVYRVSIEHLNESKDLSTFERWRLGRRARGRMRLVVWNSAALRWKVTGNRGSAVKFLLRSVSSGWSMLLPPVVGAARRMYAGSAKEIPMPVGLRTQDPVSFEVLSPQPRPADEICDSVTRLNG